MNRDVSAHAKGSGESEKLYDMAVKSKPHVHRKREEERERERERERGI